MHSDEVPTATQFDAKYQPPRCRHILLSGDDCGQPALRGADLCRFHRAVAPTRREFILPIVEDAASLQLALNRVMRALADGLLDYKKASLLLYALQIAASNFKRLREERQLSTQQAAAVEDESLVKLLLKQLAIPETPEELAAELAAGMPDPLNPPRQPLAGFPLPPPAQQRFDIKLDVNAPDHRAELSPPGPRISGYHPPGVRT